jgi:hypothetical protein
MARAALSVVFNQGRDEELAALRARVAELTAERSATRWAALCRAGVHLCAGLDHIRGQFAVRCLIADFVVEEGWCVAEGVTGRFYCPAGRLNFNMDAEGRLMHIESLLVNKVAVDLLHGRWHPLQHYLDYIAGCGIYSAGLFYQGSAPPRAAEEYNRWVHESEGSDSEA